MFPFGKQVFFYGDAKRNFNHYLSLKKKKKNINQIVICRLQFLLKVAYLIKHW